MLSLFVPHTLANALGHDTVIVKNRITQKVSIFKHQMTMNGKDACLPPVLQTLSQRIIILSSV